MQGAHKPVIARSVAEPRQTRCARITTAGQGRRHHGAARPSGGVVDCHERIGRHSVPAGWRRHAVSDRVRRPVAPALHAPARKSRDAGFPPGLRGGCGPPISRGLQDKGVRLMKCPIDGTAPRDDRTAPGSRSTIARNAGGSGSTGANSNKIVERKRPAAAAKGGDTYYEEEYGRRAGPVAGPFASAPQEAGRVSRGTVRLLRLRRTGVPATSLRALARPVIGSGVNRRKTPWDLDRIIAMLIVGALAGMARGASRQGPGLRARRQHRGRDRRRGAGRVHLPRRGLGGRRRVLRVGDPRDARRGDPPGADRGWDEAGLREARAPKGDGLRASRRRAWFAVRRERVA